MQLTLLARLALAVALACPAICTPQSVVTNNINNTENTDNSYVDPKRPPGMDRSVHPPSQDAFYDVPLGVEVFAQGQILRMRTPPSPFAALNYTVERKYLRDAYQFLYRTMDKNKNATATVMTVLVPPKAHYHKVICLDAVQDASSIDCAPSFSFQNASRQYPKLSAPIVQLQLLTVEDFLNRGWIVIVPDAAGPMGAYPPNEMGAYATLDAMRAALNSGPFTGVSRHAKFAMWGYSGGASTTLASLQMQPMYAPELNIVAAAIGGGGGDDIPFLSAVRILNKTAAANFIVLALAGRAATDPQFRRELEQHLKPENREHFFEIKDICLDAAEKTFGNEDILAMFDDTTFVTNMTNPVPIYQNSTPAVPIYWYQSVHDQLISPESTNSAARRFCSRGANIHYVLDTAPNVTHLSYSLVGTERSLDWLGGYLDGISQPFVGCSNETIETPGVPKAFLDLFPPGVQKAILQIVTSRPA